MDIKTRPFLDEDIDSLLPVLLKTWDYGFSFVEEKRRKATELFLYHCLALSDYRKVLTVSSQVIGVMLVSTIRRYQDSHYSSLYQRLSEEYRKDKEVDELCKYNDVVFLSNETLKKNRKEDFEEIILLILDKDYQGNGYGRILLDEYHASRDKSHPVLLTSDEDCNYRFYLHFGYEIVSECTLPYEFCFNKEILHSFLFYMK